MSRYWKMSLAEKFGPEKVVLSEMINLFLFHELLVIGKT